MLCIQQCSMQHSLCTASLINIRLIKRVREAQLCLILFSNVMDHCLNYLGQHKLLFCMQYKQKAVLSQINRTQRAQCLTSDQMSINAQLLPLPLELFCKVDNVAFGRYVCFPPPPPPSPLQQWPAMCPEHNTKEKQQTSQVQGCWMTCLCMVRKAAAAVSQPNDNRRRPKHNGRVERVFVHGARCLCMLSVCW